MPGIVTDTGVVWGGAEINQAAGSATRGRRPGDDLLAYGVAGMQIADQ
jgi:hypothetical protein